MGTSGCNEKCPCQHLIHLYPFLRSDNTIKFIYTNIPPKISYFRFSVDKDDDAQVFKLSLAFDLTIDGAETMFPVLTDTSVPIPVCSDDPFVLPGDGSIEGFVKVVGNNVGQTAVDVVLKQLGLQVMCSYKLYVSLDISGHFLFGISFRLAEITIEIIYMI